MTEGVVTMSRGEVDRLGVVQQVQARRLTQAQAAERLGLSVRQLKRLVRRFRDHGAQGLVSRHRGRRANNAISDAVREEALGWVRERYWDFSPTLAHEKLTEEHDYRFSVKTLRQWMIAEGLWQGRAGAAARVYQRRPRRPCRGELVQIDGSPHDWLEGRGPRATLIVFIDDATSELMALRLVPAETTFAYLDTLRGYLAEHGRPVALYSDRHSVFRVNQPECENELTQFGRALKSLDIQAIHARTPQAKGRVERANKTLQDRLVKELRLAGIDTLEAANAFLPGCLKAFNRRFAVTAQHPSDAHRPVLHEAQELDYILATHHRRVLSKNLTCQLEGRELQLTGYGKGYRLRGATVTICKASDGELTVLRSGKSLAYRLLQQGETPTPLADEKDLHQTVE